MRTSTVAYMKAPPQICGHYAPCEVSTIPRHRPAAWGQQQRSMELSQHHTLRRPFSLAGKAAVERSAARGPACTAQPRGCMGKARLCQLAVQRAPREGKGPTSFLQPLQRRGARPVFTSSCLVHPMVVAATRETSKGAARRNFIRDGCASSGGSVDDSSSVIINSGGSSSISSEKSHRLQGNTKVCIAPDCGEARELRFFQPSKSAADGLWPICHGCKFRADTFRRLVTREGRSRSQAEAECKDRFDRPGATCKRCGYHLPATFFHQGQATRCISCRREIAAQRLKRKEAQVKRDPPREKKCSRCKQVLPNIRFFPSKDTRLGLSSECRDCARESQRLRRESLVKVPFPPEVHAPEKRCTICQQVKPRSHFYRAPHMPSAVRNACKACEQERRRELAAQVAESVAGHNTR
mmetsp:Transcript_5625/g.16065  ORF Transcript_5625/g.16065 Transcript_5625/m.16065 type:complete len:410 (-) Transcript_5625:3415-4644(-)